MALPRPLLSFCVLLLAAFTPTVAVVEDVPGVAFSLTPDHGTAAIYFANGSFIAVAQTEGSPAYKAFMRSDKPEQTEPQHPLCHILPFAIQRSTTLCAPSPATAAAESLILTLKAAVSSYLATEICYVDLALPQNLYTSQPQKQTLQESLTRAGLRPASLLTNLVARSANTVGLYANDIPSRPDADGPQAVVSIDYGRSGLNAVLFCEDRGVLEALREEYVDVSHDGGEAGSSARLEAVAAVLRDVARPPFGSCSGWEMGHEVHTLALHGEYAHEPDFLRLLGRVFGSAKVKGAYALNPPYAAAMGAAKASFVSMEHSGVKVPAAFGCRWKSGLEYRYNENVEL